MKLDDFITCGDSGYESPITLTAEKMRIEQEENIFKAIQKFNINVNKEELIKALQYDRNQYEKGYCDGYNEAMKKIQGMYEQMGGIIGNDGGK